MDRGGAFTGRLAPWPPPVAFGFGIVVYFTAGRELAWWAAPRAATLGIAIAVWARRSVVGLPLALGFAAIATGFAVATLQTAARIAHPVLAYPTWRAQVEGFVETREERARSDRIVVRVSTITAPRMRLKPQRVRVAVRKGTAPAVGRFVAFKAHLAPPLQPLPAGRLRLRPRHVFSAHRRLRLRARVDPEPLRHRRTRPASGCATPRFSTWCAKPSTSASTPSCPATAARIVFRP